MDGKIVARKVISTDLNWWPDDEFQKNMVLEDLDKEKEFTDKYFHLSCMPSEEQLKEKGIDMAEMSSLQMREIEKLYKYLFLFKKELVRQLDENEMLKQKITELENKQ